MTDTIVLLCLGSKYGYWATNLAATLRVQVKERILLLCDNSALNFIERNLFDEVKVMQEQHYINSAGKFSPGWAKLNIGHYAKNGRYLYLDIDAVCSGTVSHLFCNGFNAQVANYYPFDAKEWQCQWMPLAKVREVYELNPNQVLTEINSSAMAWDDSGLAVFEQAQKNYLANYGGNQWGGTFPDELAFNVALNQLGIKPTGLKAVNFGSNPDWPIVGFYGGKFFLPKRHTDKYDAAVRSAFKKLYGHVNVKGKYSELLKSKHVEQKRTTERVNHLDVVVKNTIGAVKPMISEFIEIPNSELLEGDAFMNGAMCYHKGELYYAYRILKASTGWWRESRLALTKLDKETFMPLTPGHILDVQSSNGLNVEDARLISDKRGLVMLYTENKNQYLAYDFDGKQFRATKELQRKNRQAIEKNWVAIPNEDRYIVNLNEKMEFSDGEIKKGITWKYGTIRGGTPLVEYKDKWVTFFHSKIEFNIPSHFRVYYAGVLILDKAFNVLYHSKKPMFMPRFEGANLPRPDKNIHCIFPSGAIVQGDTIYVSAGENDHRTIIFNVENLLSLKNDT